MFATARPSVDLRRMGGGRPTATPHADFATPHEIGAFTNNAG